MHPVPVVVEVGDVPALHLGHRHTAADRQDEVFGHAPRHPLRAPPAVHLGMLLEMARREFGINGQTGASPFSVGAGLPFPASSGACGQSEGTEMGTGPVEPGCRRLPSGTALRIGRRPRGLSMFAAWPWFGPSGSGQYCRWERRHRPFGRVFVRKGELCRLLTLPVQEVMFPVVEHKFQIWCQRRHFRSVDRLISEIDE